MEFHGKRDNMLIKSDLNTPGVKLNRDSSDEKISRKTIGREALQMRSVISVDLRTD